MNRHVGKLDGVWTVEPWVSRLELEATGKVYLEQKETITAVLVASARMLREKSDLVKAFAATHAELTDWINAHPVEAKELANAELKEISKREMPAPLIDHAWSRITFTSAVKKADFDASVAEAQSVGFLKGAIDLSRLVVKP